MVFCRLVLGCNHVPPKAMEKILISLSQQTTDPMNSMMLNICSTSFHERNTSVFGSRGWSSGRRGKSYPAEQASCTEKTKQVFPTWSQTFSFGENHWSMLKARDSSSHETVLELWSGLCCRSARTLHGIRTHPILRSWYCLLKYPNFCPFTSTQTPHQ